MLLAFELIKVAIGNLEALSRVPTDDEWKEMFVFSIKQTLVGVMFSGIEKLPKEQRPPRRLLLTWLVQTDTIRDRNKELRESVLKVVKAFEKDGRRSVLLKGQGLALLYPSPERRMPGDIDLWVEGRRDDIVRLLRQKGENGPVVYHNMPYRLFDNVTLEVHFTPSWMNNYFTNRVLQRFFADQQEVQFQNRVALDGGDVFVSIPTDAFNRVFILQHIYRHLFGSGIGLRQLMDYYFVLQRGCTDAEKAETLLMLRRLHMLKFTAGIMYVLGYVLGLKEEKMLVAPNVKEGQFLLSEILRAGNFGHYDDRIKIPENENKLHSFFRITKQNMRLLKHYPEETLWNPLYRAWHYCWRKYKGYPIR